MDISLFFKRVCRVLLGFCRYHYFIIIVSLLSCSKWLDSRKRDCLNTNEQQKMMMLKITQLIILQLLNSNGACCSSLLDSLKALTSGPRTHSIGLNVRVRNSLNSDIKIARELYYKKSFNEHKNDSWRTWQTRLVWCITHSIRCTRGIHWTFFHDSSQTCKWNYFSSKWAQQLFWAS